MSIDRILLPGTLWTGVPGDPPRRGWGIAISSGRIAAVGPADTLRSGAASRTSVLELPGAAVIPGFVDAHVHLLAGGLDLFRLELGGIRSPEGLARRVADRARVVPPGEWILGGGWDEHAWGGPLPRREWLDPVAPDHPVFLLRTDMHVGLANSLALDRAGIDAGTPDPDRGVIDRDSDGTPTGILRERALELVSGVLPAPTDADRRAAIRAAVRLALSRGITQLHDMGALQSAEESWASLRALRGLSDEGRLPLRVQAHVPLSERHELAELVAREGTGGDRLRWGGVKGFVDGSVGGATAWMHAPYDHLADHSGGPITDPGELRAGILDAARMGLQPVTHAIGDRAVDWLLEVYDGIPGPLGPHRLRPRIEHAQHWSVRGLERASRRPVHLSMQPSHLVDDGPWIEDRIGADRLRRAYPLRTLADAGAWLAFGSDWTVAPLDPLVAVAAAVERRGRDGVPRVREEALSLPEALRAHTLGGADAASWRGETGMLEPGRWADLAVLEPSPFEGDLGTSVTMTFVGGALVWRKDDAPEDGASRTKPAGEPQR